MNDLDTLFPAPVTIKVAGVTIEVRELTVAKLPGFLRASAPVLSALANDAGVDFGTVLTDASGIIDAVQIATDVERAWLDGLPARELLRLLEAVIEANADFFAVALPDFVKTLVARSTRTADGSMKSNSSLRTDIDGATSSSTP